MAPLNGGRRWTGVSIGLRYPDPLVLRQWRLTLV